MMVGDEFFAQPQRAVRSGPSVLVWKRKFTIEPNKPLDPTAEAAAG